MKLLLTLVLAASIGGCAVVAVADLAVTTIATVAKAGVQTAGAVVDTVMPDKKSEKAKTPEKDKGK
jgi:hypothetical protein